MLTNSQIAGLIVGPRIGKGAFGEIYLVQDSHTRSYYAMKVEPKRTKRRVLDFEIQIMKQLHSYSFPAYISAGRSQNFTFLVMEFLGPSLSTIRKRLPYGSFSLSTALRAAYCTLQNIEELHNNGIIHRDIKPSNILLRHDRLHPFALIDFGLSRLYKDLSTNEIYPPRKKPGFRGTVIYASIHAHNQEELSRRDDIISWFYMLLDLIHPHFLPWRTAAHKELIADIKRKIDMVELSSEISPHLANIWQMINLLQFADEPNYDGIRSILRRYMEENGIKDTDEWDWHPSFFSMDAGDPIDIRGSLGNSFISGFSETGDNPNVYLLGPQIQKPCCSCCLLL